MSNESEGQLIADVGAQAGFLKVVTPDGRLVVEFGGDGSVHVGDLDHPELVSALREAFAPRPCWCAPGGMAWHECPVHGGAFAREIPMETHIRRMHDAYAIAQGDVPTRTENP